MGLPVGGNRIKVSSGSGNPNRDDEMVVFPKVKICCIKNVAEARLAISQGASALGMVSAMPSGPGVIDEVTIAEIARLIPPGISSFLLTSQREPEAIIAQQKRCGVNTLQLCDSLEPCAHRQLREALPGIHLVQVIHVTGPESLDEARELASEVDALLLDSGNPSLTIKELGGTDRVHNWEISREICRQIEKPVFLAGGLRPENVEDAIRQVSPYGLDLCSGVRKDDQLDGEKLAAFFNRVQRAVSG